MLAEALARVALDDRTAFATLYEATSAQLFGVILRIQTDRAHAEGCMPDVCINIWRAAQGFDDERAPPLTWLASIARNCAIDSLRRRKTGVSTAPPLPPCRSATPSRPKWTPTCGARCLRRTSR